MLVLVLLVVVAAGALATSIAQFAASIPNIKANLPEILAPWQAWLDSIGLGQIDLVAQAEAALGNLDQFAGALVEPLQQIAVASLSVVGTMLIVFFLSIYMVLDRDVVLAFLFRIVPPTYSEEARLLRDVGLALVRRLPARPGADGLRLLPHRARDEPAAGAPARGTDLGRRRPPPDDPVLRPVRLVGAAGHRGAGPPSPSPSCRRSS